MKKFLKCIYIFILLFCVGTVFYGCSTSTAVTAYELAVEYGFTGTEEEWLESLVVEGDSAYDIAVEDGFEGTEEEWLASLKGASAYDLAVENGYTGTEAEWLASLNGMSAYEIAVVNGYEGDVVSWLTSLIVVDDATAENFSAGSLYELGVSLGEYTDDSAGYSEFMADYLATMLDSSSTSVQQVAAQCVNQVVSIYTQDGAGAGVIYEINEIEQYAYIITNYHVVVLSTTSGIGPDATTTYAPATEIYFYTFGAETVSVTTESEYDFGDEYMMAEYVGGSAGYDIAVLKVTGDYFTKLNGTDAEAVTFADTTNLQAGTTAIAIGNPLAEGIAVTSGVVSVDRELVTVEIAGEDRYLTCLRLDTSINGGNSGGGVFDESGNLIGIANAKYSSSEYENIANAILASNVKSVAENIIYFYEENLADDSITDKTVGVHKYAIGYYYNVVNPISTYDETTSTNNKSCDITVTEIIADSVAETIGLAVGDVVRALRIKRAGSETYETITFDMGYDLSDFMLTVRPGDEIILVVDRLQSGTTDTYESHDLTNFTVDILKYVEYKNNAVIV